MAKLTFILQNGQEIEVQLREVTTIGRSEENEVVVDSPMISAKHACVKHAGSDRFEVQDLQSEGGTFVNDERVDHQLLKHGDRLKFGLLHAVFARDFAEEVADHAGGKDLQEMSDWLEPDRDFEEDSSGAINTRRVRRSGAVDEELERSRGQLVRTEAELQMQKQKLVEVKATLAEAESAGQDLADELQVLETRRDTMMGQLRDAHARLDSMQVAYFQAEQGSQTHEQRARELQEEIRSAEENRRGALQRCEEAEVLYLEAQGKLDSLNVEVGKVEGLLAETSTKLAAVRSEEMTRGVEVDRLLGEERRLKELCERLAGTEKQLGEKETALAELRGRYELKNIEWQKLLGQTEVARWDWDEATKRRDDVAERLRVVTQDHLDATERLNRTLAEIEVYGLQLEQASLDAAGKLQEARAFQGHLEHLQSTRDALQGRVDGLTGAEEKLLAAQAALGGVQEQERSVSEALRALVTKRDDEERNLVQLTLGLEKLGYELEQETVQLQTLEEKNQLLREELLRATEELAQKNEALKTLRQDGETTQRELEEKRTTLSGELERLSGEVETTSARLQEVTAQRAIIATQCDELADTEQRLTATREDLAKKQSQREELETRIAVLTEERKGLEKAVESLSGDEKATELRLEELRLNEGRLNDSIKALGELEQVDRERFQAIQHLMKEAEKEKGQQAEMLDRDILMKQRELSEIEDRLGQLLQWKELMDERYAQLEALPESSQGAELLWNQLNQDKVQMGQVLSAPQQGGQTSYSHGPVLRGHARQLEAKIRRDEERHANLRRKVEQLETQEVEKIDRLSRLERRLAQLRVDIARVEREHGELGLKPHAEEAENNDEGFGRSILGSIIEGSRAKLKSM